MYARVVLTLQVPLYQLWVSAYSQATYLIGIRPCTLMSFGVAIETALRTRVYFSLWALAHFLERGVRLDCQVSHALPGRHA